MAQKDFRELNLDYDHFGHIMWVKWDPFTTQPNKFLLLGVTVGNDLSGEYDCSTAFSCVAAACWRVQRVAGPPQNHWKSPNSRQILMASSDATTYGEYTGIITESSLFSQILEDNCWRQNLLIKWFRQKKTSANSSGTGASWVS